MDLIPVAPKLSKRFYKALLLLSILGKNRGDRIKEDLLLDQEGRATKLLPPFLRSLAYLCDFKKGGDSTTAIALQQTPQGVVFWLASNNHKAGAIDPTKAFLQEVLGALKNVNQENQELIESELFDKSVTFSWKRITAYAKMLETPLISVLNHLAGLEPKEGMSVEPKKATCPDLAPKDSFVEFLEEIKNALQKPSKLCRMCHEMSPARYTTLRLKAVPGEPCQEQFKSVRHTIGRLNHTLKAVKTIVTTALTERRIFDDFEVMRVLSSCRSPPPLQDRKPTLAAIAGRLLSGPTNIASLRGTLKELDQKFNLSTRLAQEYNSTTWRPTVHAELILLNEFWTRKLQFVDQDRYIGCSKPACYCCYHYILAHPGQFVVPHSSNNSYLNWKAPDIYGNGTVLTKTREDILNEMAKKIRIDVLNQIQEKRGPAPWRPDSVTEISTVQFDELRWHTSGSSTKLGDLPEAINDGRIEETGDGGWIIGQESESESEDDEVGGVLL